MEITVTEAESAAYWRVVNDQIALTRGPIPTLLWHYTGGAALIDIITSGELWSTQISCLNDVAELRYSAKLYIEAIEAFAKSRALSPDEQLLYDLINARLTDNNEASEWFVTCFSELGDDLSQWRGYGGGECGYSIALGVPEVLEHGGRDYAYLAKVCYDEGVHKQIAASVAQATFELFIAGLPSRGDTKSQWAEAFMATWVKHITYLAPIMKHPAFAAEREWRIVRMLRATDRPKMRYRQKATLLSRHLPLRYCAADTPARLPIKTVMVGPARNTHVTRISVGDLLLGNDYHGVTVETSAVPYQAV